jgi:nitrate reductase cytochrome c-type subunit
MASATLIDGTKVTSIGEGILCIQCHQSRMAASTVPTTAGSAHFGPHEGPQADMLMGTNGYTYGESIPSSAHQYVVTNACVDCHMQTVASTDPAFLNAGDHTFKTTYSPTGKPAEDLVAACQTCHGPEVTTFDFPLFDYNGDGVIDGVQTEVQSLMDQLSTLLPPNNSVKTSLTIDSTWTKPQLEAAYNWLFVTNDGSRGIHNTAYAVGLLKASIANLQPQK